MSTIAYAPRVSRPATSVRLTARGRAVVFVLALAVVAAFAVWLAAASAAGGDATGSSSDLAVVVVEPGDTLWDIAGDAAAATGEGDIRDMVDRIQELNTLDGVMVYAGQQLRVPAAG